MLKQIPFISWCMLMLAVVAVGACQPSNRCCSLAYGLLQPADLNGNWKPVDESLQLLQPSGRYKQPAAEFKRQYLYGSDNSSSERPKMIVIHDLRRYDPIAPQLGEWAFRLDSHTPGSRPFDPGVKQVGQLSQTQCQTDDQSTSNSIYTICVAETRYSHFISTIYFYFDVATPNEDMKTLIEQALTKTDERIQEIDQRLEDMSG